MEGDIPRPRAAATPLAGALAPPSAWRPRWYAHPYNRAEIYRVAAALAWLPRPLRLRLASGLGRLAVSRLPAERAAARTTLGVVTGATGRRLDALTAQLFAEYAMCFSDLLSTNRLAPGRLLGHVASTTGGEHLDRLPGAVVSLTAHVGNWDMAGRLLAGKSGRPTNVVVAVEEVRALESWLRRDGDGVRFVARAQPTVSLALLGALRRGEVVAMQGDRALGSRGDVLVAFFGRPAPFPVGPFRLARAAGVPVVPAFCTLEPGRRYAVTVLPPLTIGAGEEEAGLRTWVGALERLVQERPTQWFNFFDVWDPFRA
jgi:lauroyl/myristoyl acyltransferase